LPLSRVLHACACRSTPCCTRMRTGTLTAEGAAHCMRSLERNRICDAACHAALTLACCNLLGGRSD